MFYLLVFQMWFLVAWLPAWLLVVLGLGSAIWVCMALSQLNTLYTIGSVVYKFVLHAAVWTERFARFVLKEYRRACSEHLPKQIQPTVSTTTIQQEGFPSHFDIAHDTFQVDGFEDIVGRAVSRQDAATGKTIHCIELCSKAHAAKEPSVTITQDIFERVFLRALITS